MESKVTQAKTLGNRPLRKYTPAVQVVIIFGLISMLGDMVYEAARGANSQYLNLLGFSAAKVGLIFGFGEFLGYFLRLIAGVWSDKSSKYWLFLFTGYGMLLVVPLIGLTMNWNILVVLILMERIGKALRSPAKDTIISTVAENQVGIGFAFGLQEALDQLGAFSGPLFFALVFFLTGRNGVLQYQLGYRLLILPFVALMLFLAYAQRRVHRGNLAPIVTPKGFEAESLRPLFWLYTAFTFFCALGLVNFSIVGYHLKANALMSDGGITLLYSGAMIIDAVAAVMVGRAYDRIKQTSGRKTGGLLVLLGIPALTLMLPLLTLSPSVPLIVLGMAIFGVIIGMHETIMRSAIADITPVSKRGTGYGVFNAGYGLALLGGSALIGWLYDCGWMGTITVFTLVAEAIALALYYRMSSAVKA